MNGKFAYVALTLIALVLVSGCIGDQGATPAEGQQPAGGTCNAPKKMIGDICCYDENNNGVCDIEDVGCPSSCDDGNACTNDTCSAGTDFECVHEAVAPCCGNGVCETSEDTGNGCPEDCTIVDMTHFQYRGIPDYMEGDKFVFIHTSSTENTSRLFYLNITAGDGGMENIRYTFACNSTQNGDLDSIDSEPENVTDDEDVYKNKLDDKHYLIYSYFFQKKAPIYSRDIDELDEDDKAWFYFDIKKKEPQKRDDLTCMFKFYIIEPRKIVYEPLDISFI